MSTPARYLRSEVYQALASQYVCGTLRGPARRRFMSLMQRHAEIASAVSSWEKQMDGLNDTRKDIEPRSAVWASLEKELFQEQSEVQTKGGLRALLGQWWIGLSGIATTAVLAMVLTFQSLQPPERVNYVAVMETQSGQAQWVATSSKETRKLRVERVGEPLNLDSSMVVWAVSKEDGSIYKFGQVQAKERNWIDLSDEAWGKIKSAESLFVTEEESLNVLKPSGQVVAKGLCVQLKYDEIKSV